MIVRIIIFVLVILVFTLIAYNLLKDTTHTRKKIDKANKRAREKSKE